MPERTCPVCRVRSAPTGMIRFVRIDDTAIPDLAQRRAGRGAWVHGKCLRDLARQPEILGRALRHRATAPSGLVANVTLALEQAMDAERHQARRLGLASLTVDGGVLCSRRTRRLRTKLALLAEIG